MAFIQPNSVIELMSNVPLEPDYEHTYWSADSPYYALAGYTKYSLRPNTYQRVNSERIRVGISADNLYDCNYLAFQNTNFGSKWFFAFITSVEYINNECTEITYEIDVMQTYAGCYQLGACYVEREHSVTDNLFENYIPESVNIGDLVLDSGYSELFSPNKINIYILAVNYQLPHHNVGNIVENTFTGGNLHAWTIDGSAGSINSARASIQAFLNDYENVPENIIAIWTGPALNTDYSSNHTVPIGAHAYGSYNGTGIGGTETFGGYTPKNKKLYTYPYNYYTVTNGNSSLDLHYEYFSGAGGSNAPSFTLLASMMPTPECICYPTNYKGSGDFATMGSLAESLNLKGWGVGSWTNDTWAQLVRNKAVDFGLDVANPVAIMSPLGYGYGVLKGIHEVNSVIAKENFIPKTTYGSSHSGGALASDGKLCFYGGRMRVTEQMAKVIDDYFSVYGYQTNRVKVPNTSSRLHWNYVKTANCELKTLEAMPATAASKIKSIFNKGVTLWKRLDEIGHFELDNSV